MDDLRRRFASLDRLRSPDLWHEIELRAAAIGSAEREMEDVAPIAVRSRGFSGRSLAVLVAMALLAGLVAGAIAVGSGLVKLPALLPSPPPAEPTPWQVPSASGAAIDPCNPGAEGGPGWPGSATSPGSVAEVQAGLIAGWAMAPNSQLVMVADPARGTMTQLTQTPITYSNYEGGVVRWSPDGRALAVGWAGRDPERGTRQSRDCQDLFVAIGGAFTRASAAPVDAFRWSWSPDSTRLAATVVGTSVVILRQDGDGIDLGSPCDRCRITGEYSPSGLSWSPSGSMLAAPYAINDPQTDATVAAGVAFTDLSHPEWRAHSFDEAWHVAVVGWMDDDHLLVNVTTGDDERGELVAVSATDPDDVMTLAIDVATGAAPQSVQLAPDRSSILIWPASAGDPHEVAIVDLGTMTRKSIHRGAAVVTTAWSPDSSAVAIVSGVGGDEPGGGWVRYELAVFEPSTGQPRTVWTGSTDFPGFVWSPDSSQLAISGAISGEIGLWVVDRDGSDLRRVSDTPLWYMSWQPAWP